MSDSYIITPGSTFEPGDIFLEVPFPHIRHPFRRYRRSTKPQDKNRPEIFVSETGADRADDIIHATFQRKQVMLLSHGCELDKVLQYGKDPTRYQWSSAPLEPFEPHPSSDKTRDLQERIRNGTQPNRFYIPENEFLPGEHAVDLRRITPLPAQFFRDAHKLFSLGSDAKFELYAQLGVNQSGYAIYVQDVDCPHCGGEIRLTEFLVESTDDEEFPE